MGLDVQDVIDKRFDVLGQLLRIEAQLANHARGRCRSASLRNSTLPALYSFTVLPMSGVTVPARGEGISPRGPSTSPSGPTNAHHIGRGDTGVEIGPAVLDLLGRQILSPDFIRSGGFGFLGLVSLGEHDHPLSTCRCRAAGRSSRAPVDRPASDRCPGGSRSRPSDRTSCVETASEF